MDREKFIKENIERIKENIYKVCNKRGRSPEEVKIMAVSKKMSVGDILVAMENGIKIIGENIVQEAERKYKEIEPVLRKKDVEFHFIGHLQSNKAKVAVEIFNSIDTIDRIKIIDKLEENCKRNNKIINCMIQVNIAEEETKFGIKQEEILDLIVRMKNVEKLKACGLFFIAPFFENPEEARPYFRQLRILRDRLKEEHKWLELKELCMGMTNDYMVAVEEGATIVRLGRAIFGERK